MTASASARREPEAAGRRAASRIAKIPPRRANFRNLFLACGVFAGLAWLGSAPASPLPSGEGIPRQSTAVKPASAETLTLPTQSERIANYTIEAELDATRKSVTAHQVLEWRNTTGMPLSEFHFHLYMNAFKNNRSTYFLEQGGDAEDDERDDAFWGFTRIDRIRLLAAEGAAEADLTATLAYVQPDDDNQDDQTVFRIRTPQAVAAGATMRLEFQFNTQLPRSRDRCGYRGDFFFVAHWFPKIGVFRDGRWNCHQFHANSEFFSDFGNYAVQLTVPAGFTVAATGSEVSRETVGGKIRYRFAQPDVHDFTWAASPDFLVLQREFSYPRLRPVTVKLFLQPEHAGQAERHFRAVLEGLRYFGEWYGEYPYPTLTVVDPPFGSTVGGMEYPTLITAGTDWWAPASVQSPEGVTVHEFGHQFWYGLVANNEFEEAWLDEGFNTYSTAKVLDKAYGDDRYIRRFFGAVPFVSEELKLRRHETDRAEVRSRGAVDVMARRAWEYRGSYGVNSYSKPGLVLFTLEKILGEATMTRILRVYQHRWRFKHPSTKDFIATVNEVAGRDMTEFFQQTFYSSGLVDYAVESVSNRDESAREGHFDAAASDGSGTRGKNYHSEVVVRRLGEARLPVELLVRFKDGSTRRELWDGQYTWKRFSYDSPSEVVEAVVDPDARLPLDVNPANNGRLASRGDSWAARKWAGRWLFWLQHLLDVSAFLL